MAQQSESLKNQIGAPYTLGPWYNARIGAHIKAAPSCRCNCTGMRPMTLTDVHGYRYLHGFVRYHAGFSSGSHIASCSFQLQGQRQITDVTVRGMRQPGIGNTLAYNLVGSGRWTVFDCTAMFPSGGGLVRPQSLLPEDQRAPVRAQADPACASCESSGSTVEAQGKSDSSRGSGLTVGSQSSPSPAPPAPAAGQEQATKPWWQFWR